MNEKEEQLTGEDLWKKAGFQVHYLKSEIRLIGLKQSFSIGKYATRETIHPGYSEDLKKKYYEVFPS